MKVGILAIALSTVALASNKYIELGFGVSRGNDQSRPVRRSDPIEGLDYLEAVLKNQKTFYTTNVSIGTPPQSVQILIDTGSSDIWITAADTPQCKASGGDLDCNFGVFDDTKSSTLKDDESYSGPFEISYADETYAKGSWKQDSVSLASSIIVQDVTFGLANDTTSHVSVFGLGYESNESRDVKYSNFPTLLKSQGFVDKVAYSIYLNSADADSGNILFGAIDHAKYEGELVPIPIPKGNGRDLLQLALNGVWIESDQPVISSSSSSDVLLVSLTIVSDESPKSSSSVEVSESPVITFLSESASTVPSEIPSLESSVEDPITSSVFSEISSESEAIASTTELTSTDISSSSEIPNSEVSVENPITSSPFSEVSSEAEAIASTTELTSSDISSSSEIPSSEVSVDNPITLSLSSEVLGSVIMSLIESASTDISPSLDNESSESIDLNTETSSLFSQPDELPLSLEVVSNTESSVASSSYSSEVVGEATYEPTTLETSTVDSVDPNQEPSSANIVFTETANFTVTEIILVSSAPPAQRVVTITELNIVTISHTVKEVVSVTETAYPRGGDLRKRDRVGSVDTQGNAALIDTGSSYSYFPKEVLAELLSGFGPGVAFNEAWNSYIVPCNVKDQNLDVWFSFNGKDINVPLSSFILDYQSDDGCIFTILPGGYSLGDNVLRHVYAVFDLEDNTISLAKAKYTDERNIQEII